jgi:hypothetical protein
MRESERLSLRGKEELEPHSMRGKEELEPLSMRGKEELEPLSMRERGSGEGTGLPEHSPIPNPHPALRATLSRGERGKA